MSPICQNPECGRELDSPKGPGRQVKWCSERCRKSQYAGTCVDCGAPTNGYDGPGTAGKRCQPCASRYQHETRRWTPAAIVEAVRKWAALHGRQPIANDWRRGGPDYPPASVVVREMGWNAAILAAGFDARLRSPKGIDRTEVIRLYVDERLGSDTIARRLGVTPTTVLYHLRQAGIQRRQPERQAA